MKINENVSKVNKKVLNTAKRKINISPGDPFLPKRKEKRKMLEPHQGDSRWNVSNLVKGKFVSFDGNFS